MDVAVTVPRDLWDEWLGEGDRAGDPESGTDYHFWIGRMRPTRLSPGDRIYVVARGRLRGYAPLVRVHLDPRAGRYALVRRGGAVATTLAASVPGFRGWRYRWWDRSEEIPFPGWRTP